jgi:hypothetical protein
MLPNSKHVRVQGITKMGQAGSLAHFTSLLENKESKEKNNMYARNTVI